MLNRALCPSRVCFGLPVDPLGASQLPDLDLHGLAAQAEVLHDVEILRTFLRARDGRVSDEREGLCYMSISSKRPPKVTDRHCIGRYAHDSTQTSHLTHPAPYDPFERPHAECKDPVMESTRLAARRMQRYADRSRQAFGHDRHVRDDDICSSADPAVGT